MALLTRFVDFRWLFAKRIIISGSFTFTAASPPTISRAAGDFVADGVTVGMVVQPIDTASNDRVRFTVAVAAATLLTLTAGDAVVAEGPVAAKLQVLMVGVDAYEEWPGLLAGQAGRVNLVRSGGFTAGFTGIPKPYVTGSAFECTVNATAADATPGVDEFDWYLAQRTDDAAKQYVSIAQKVPNYTLTPYASYSGTVVISHTSLVITELAISGDLSVDQCTQLFRFCDLYCRRRSDGAIQWVSLLRAMFNAA